MEKMEKKWMSFSILKNYIGENDLNVDEILKSDLECCFPKHSKLTFKMEISKLHVDNKKHR